MARVSMTWITSTFGREVLTPVRARAGVNPSARHIFHVGPVGLEPTTRGLKVRCSAN